MGVRGLQSFMESHCGQACYSVNIGKVADEYQKRTGKTPLIVVDGMSCLRKLYGKLNWICGGQWKGYIEHIQDFQKSLQQHGIKLVLFFDGNTPERKRETWTHRRLENLKDVINYFTIIKSNKELEHGKHFFLPTGLAAFTPLIFKDILGCPVYTCLEECDKAVAEYAKIHGAMGILGQDSDYIIYNTAHYYFSINHLNLETLDTVMYDRNALCRVLHIAVDQLPLLSCLIGNDVIHQEDLLLFHQQHLRISMHQLHRHHNRPPPEILIPKVATFINNQPPMEQLNQQLPSLARVVFRDENRAHLLIDGIGMYQLDIETPDEFSNQPTEVQGMDIMDRVRLRHINSELGRHLFAILRGEAYESSTTLEDYTSNLPSGAIVFQALRARVYRILQKSARDGLSQVPEWCMYSGSTLKEPDLVDPVELEGGSPSLEELWDGDSDLKWRTFMDCVHPQLCETKFRTLPPHLVVPVAMLFYLQCSQPKPILKDWEMNAMMAAFLSPMREDLNQIRAVALPRIDARAVHVAAIFMKGLVNFFFLLAACDFPVSRENMVPWSFWDGKVFHHYYLRAKSGAKVEDLCEHKEKIHKQFMEMKNLILPHIAPTVPVKTAVPSSPSRSPLESPKKKGGHLGTSITPLGISPPTTPARDHPTTLAITKNVHGKNSRGSSPLVSPSSPHSKPHGKQPHRSPQPKSPVARSPVAKSSAAKSPAKSPKKIAS
ncbi:LOW QUALITY PROTEIN: constitutive coactivator of peroxisome proliferator-activated receptor gamma-like [Portunus trituberculatus]|uniref:LOW QUALITY PROTEIN: constitutive coactivator of peroxisome proliferator-activated receptor gamma-like n=1 Tax=Portunus trituberculatus TaxID=210409 RepID=UPI001E1CC281|nr:LOW QUALITY PROTEIN: constitutive coactivator of peroxisome proliferator-activated receptor gamma-like [Portunus trituberculatus]